MPASQPANFNLQEFTDVGQLLIGGRLYTYAYGTTAQKLAFTDPDGAVPHTYTADGDGGQYIALNGRGELPAPLYLGDGSYDISLKRADGTTVWTRKADGVENSLRTWMTSLAAPAGSSLIGFLQAGAGAVNRKVQDKLRESITVKDFSATAGGGVVADTAGIQAALNSTAGTKGKTVKVQDGSRISMTPGLAQAGVSKFEDVSWLADAIVQFHGPNREVVDMLNNFSDPYAVLPGFVAAVPVNERVVRAPYHPGLVLDVLTKASYNNVVQPAHQFQLDLAAHGGTFDSSQQSSLVFRKDGANRLQLVHGENATEATALHKFLPSQKLYRQFWDATTGDMGIQRSSAAYPLDVAGAARIMCDHSITSPVQSDNNSRFGGRPSLYMTFKNDTVTNTVTFQQEGATGYQAAVNAPVTAGVDSSVSLSAAKGDGTAIQILVDGFRQAMFSTTDNAHSLGYAAKRYSVVYAGTGTINTSDEREKQQIGDIEQSALRAWARVQYQQFKFNDAVEKKGADGARWHFGVMAQRVKAAFEAEGLDPFAYGVLCYDEWPEEVETWGDEYEITPAVYSQTLIGTDGRAMELEPEKKTLMRAAGSRVIRPAGNRYGVRYEEALALECAYLRSRLGA